MEKHETAFDSGADDGARSITRRQAIVAGGALVSMSSLLAACGSDDGGSASAGIGDGLAITRLSELKPFEFSDTVGEKPTLPKRLAIALPITAENHLQYTKQMERACDERGIEHVSANADGNVADSVKNIQTFLQRRCGVMYVSPVAPDTLDAVVKQALEQDVGVFNGLNGPSTLQLMTDQYQIGQFQGEAAVDWVRRNLGGKAKLAYLNPNALAPVLADRTKGALEALGAAPGIEVVNIGLTAKQWSPEGGYNATTSLLQSHPDIEAIVSGDTVITGAVKAVQAAGNTTVKYIGGTDGEATILKAISSGDSLIKSTFGFANGVYGYALGQFAADWLEGKTIPQAIRVAPFRIDSDATVKQFDAVNNDPSSTWRDSPEILDFHGLISYETRQDWIRTGLVGGPAKQ